MGHLPRLTLHPSPLQFTHSRGALQGIWDTRGGASRGAGGVPGRAPQSNRLWAPAPLQLSHPETPTGSHRYRVSLPPCASGPGLPRNHTGPPVGGRGEKPSLGGRGRGAWAGPDLSDLSVTLSREPPVSLLLSPREWSCEGPLPQLGGCSWHQAWPQQGDGRCSSGWADKDSARSLGQVAVDTADSLVAD